MSVLEEMRSRRGDPADPFDQDAARREYRGQRRHEEDRDRKNTNAGYRARLEEERKRREQERRQRSDKKPAAKKPASSKRRPAGRGRSRRSSSTRRMVRQVAAPARAQVTSGMRVVGMTLAVSALYLVLTTEEQRPTISPALNGLSGALRWLAAPDRSIPYAR